MTRLPWYFWVDVGIVMLLIFLIAFWGGIEALRRRIRGK